MKIAAVVILYHPKAEFISNLKTYYNYVDKIFLFDNSETQSSIKQDLLSLKKAVLFQNFDNEGIAKRLNEGAEKGIENQCQWMLTMDQDSSFSDDAISNYLKCFREYKNKDNVAVFGTGYSRNKKEDAEDCKPTEIKITEVNTLITSGMLVNLTLLKQIRGFDEALFIDSVDLDYLIRAHFQGFSIIKFPNINLLHELGISVYRSSIKSFFIIKKKKIIHSPLRCYYIYRNILYLESKYKKAGFQLVNLKKNQLHFLKVNFFYGRNSLKLFQYLSLARRDFKNGRMGKIEKEL